MGIMEMRETMEAYNNKNREKLVIKERTGDIIARQERLLEDAKMASILSLWDFESVVDYRE